MPLKSINAPIFTSQFAPNFSSIENGIFFSGVFCGGGGVITRTFSCTTEALTGSDVDWIGGGVNSWRRAATGGEETTFASASFFTISSGVGLLSSFEIETDSAFGCSMSFALMGDVVKVDGRGGDADNGGTTTGLGCSAGLSILTWIGADVVVTAGSDLIGSAMGTTPRLPISCNTIFIFSTRAETTCNS